MRQKVTVNNMGFLRKARAVFHDDWCSQCQSEMEVLKKQLYMLPMMVGHYISHSDAEYYKKNLILVSKKADIQTGMYACGIILYKCPKCCHRAVKLSIFLPVRDQEKQEEAFLFEKGEFDDFLNF